MNDPNELRMTLAGSPTPASDFHPTEAIIESAQQLMDDATYHIQDRVSEEVFCECLACGQVDSHTSHCFAPALERWLNEPPPPPLKGTRRNPNV